MNPTFATSSAELHRVLEGLHCHAPALALRLLEALPDFFTARRFFQTCAGLGLTEPEGLHFLGALTLVGLVSSSGSLLMKR